MSGTIALRLANADALPFRYSEYAAAVEGYVRDLQAMEGADIVDLEPLSPRPRPGGRPRPRSSSVRPSCVASDEVDTRRGQRLLRRINRSLKRQERALTQSEGLAGRPWFKHMIYAPGRLTGYAAQFLPAIEDAITDGDAATANRYRDLVLESLQRATDLASRPG